MSKPRTGAPKRVAVGLLAGALAMFGVALAPPAGAAASVTTDRLAGTTRYGTAAAIAGSSTFSAPTTAIVATGENFPDALAASSLAGANAQAPIVLTESNVYTADAKASLAALKAKGVTALTIVGGTVAIAQSVEDAIKADGFTVSRVAGDDRYETAAAIASAANTKSAAAPIGGLKAALIATGTNFPDALAGGPAAYANKLPLLLVNDTVPAETSNAIATLGIKKVYILGGTSAVSSTVEAQLVAATGNPATRLAGTNRYSTATGIADFEKATLAFPMTSALLATGENFPDALAAGPLGGQRKAPAILTAAATLSPEATAWLDANSSTLSSISAVGGTAAVADTVLAAAKTAAQNVGNDSAGKAVTTRPELTGASVIQTVTATQVTPTSPAGTYVRYTFDEALGAFAPSNIGFKVWTASGAPITADVATIETGTGTTGTTVMAIFTTLATPASAAALSKATVAFQAVRDVGGAANPEGEASIGTAGTTPATAGTTSAPDVKTVGNFRAGSRTGETAVDFTFDQAAFVATPAGFHLIDTLNVDRPCNGPAAGDTVTPSGGTIAGGGGTTVITVTCLNVGGVLNTTAGTAYSPSNVARGYVAAATVGAQATQNQTNPVEAADVGGVSLGPDMTSVAISNASGTNTVGLFTFDQAIATATASFFHLYSTTGADLGAGSAATVNSANATQVSVTFTLTTSAIGAYVLGDGAANTSGLRAIDGTYNQNDEEGFAGSASTLTPGRTAGPDLTAVVLSASTDAFGNTTGWGATYTFDSTASTTLTGPVASLFHLYLADGTRYNGGTCTAGTGAAGSTAQGTVKCTGFTGDLTGTVPSVVTTLQGAVVGTVASAAVTDPAVGLSNSEGASATTGGNGTAAS